MMKCDSKAFGCNEYGEEVVAHTLTNINGASVTVLNYGGIIQSLLMPDREGKLENVVLGFDSAEDYDKYSPYFGCITGRTAGRISGAAFEIEGTKYQLEANEGVNNLHGGPVGLNKRIWTVSESISETHGELALYYTSPHLDQGYPGTLDMVVTYGLDDSNTLTISYKATTDVSTIVTLTNHSYFNLSGDPTTNVLDNILTIPADKSVVIGEDSMPIGIADVAGGPFDFRIGKEIGKDIKADDANIKNGSGYDHPFILNKENGESIRLKDPKSGRVLTMETTEACVVCYTGNFLTSEMFVYEGKELQPHSAICLETQYFPDAINAAFIPTKLLKAGEIYREKTSFKFSAE